MSQLCSGGTRNSDRRKLIVQILVVGESNRIVNITCYNACQNSKHNNYCVILDSYAKQVENSYEVISLIVK